MNQVTSDEFHLIKFAIDEMHNDLKIKIESNTKLIEKVIKTVTILTNNMNLSTNQNQETDQNLIKFKNEKISSYYKCLKQIIVIDFK
jgi:hypothetical protein